MQQTTKRRFTVTAVIAALVFIGSSYLLVAHAAEYRRARANLVADTGAPEAHGKVRIKFGDGVLRGSLRVRDLPKQEFGSGRFYGVWFVRTDTDDKAFLGALTDRDGSIIFSRGGDGKTSFAGTHFTTGPHVNAPIDLGPEGKNLIIVLIEKSLNGLTPAPVGPVPGTGVAASGTF